MDSTSGMSYCCWCCTAKPIESFPSNGDGTICSECRPTRLKLCRKCSTRRPFTEFPKDPDEPDKRRTVCLSCKPAPAVPPTVLTIKCATCKQRKSPDAFRFTKDNLAEPICVSCMKKRLKRCVTCETAKTLDEFPRDSKGRFGRGETCVPCRASLHQERLLDSQERQRRRELNDFLLRGEREERERQAREREQQIEAERRSAQKAKKKSHARPLTDNDWREARERMMRQQGNKCAICERPFSDELRPCLDHCHATQALRGVLCTQCNHGLGNFRDQPELLQRAVAYLNQS